MTITKILVIDSEKFFFFLILKILSQVNNYIKVPFSKMLGLIKKVNLELIYCTNMFWDNFVDGIFSLQKVCIIQVGPKDSYVNLIKFSNITTLLCVFLSDCVLFVKHNPIDLHTKYKLCYCHNTRSVSIIFYYNRPQI